MRRGVLGVIAALALAGCSLGPASVAPVAVYDFGPQSPKPAAVRLAGSLALDDVHAGPQLGTTAILYRLTYQDAARLQPYSRSRWAAPPSALVGQRLRLALGHAAEHGVSAPSDGLHSEHVLRIELGAFEHLVDAADAGRVLIRARASLIGNAERSLRAQRSFEIERAAPGNDAQGAVRGLGAATDELIGEIIVWVARETGRAR